MAFTKDKRNTVKVGQMWRKKDTGVEVQIFAKHRGAYWKTKRVCKGKNNGTHIITTYDLVKYYVLL